MRRRLLGARVSLFLVLPALTAIAIGLTLAPGENTSATTNYLTTIDYTFDSTAPGAASDYSAVTDVPDPSKNFATDPGIISLSPADVFIAPSADMPIGAIVGDLTSNAILGLLNGPCNTLTPTQFTYNNATVDTSNTIDPLPADTSEPKGRFAPLAADSDANGLSQHVDQYPSFNNRLFDPDGDGPEPPLTPLVRYSGQDLVAGTDVILQAVIFDLGDFAKFSAPNPRSQVGSQFGYAAVTVLQEPGGPTNPSTITDFCNFQSITSYTGTTSDNPDTAADESGATRYRNPPAGTGIAGTDTHVWQLLSISFRDADDDGIQNDLDKCPFDPDPTYDPKSGGQADDPDGDGIQNSCDPTPNENTGLGDHDGDGFPNRQDDCPLIADPDQEESEPTGEAADGGPSDDSIGDPCDPNPTTPDGGYNAVLAPFAACIGGSDGDGDGYCDATESLLGSNAGDAGSTPEHLGLHLPIPLNDAGADIIAPATTGVAQLCTDGVDNNGSGGTDGADSGCSGTTDIDGDGFNENTELFMGTSPWHSCTAVSGQHDAWGPDVNNDGKVSIADVLALKPAFGSQSGDDNYSARVDLNADGKVSIADVLALKPVFGQSCG